MSVPLASIESHSPQSWMEVHKTPIDPQLFLKYCNAIILANLSRKQEPQQQNGDDNCTERPKKSRQNSISIIRKILLTADYPEKEKY